MCPGISWSLGVRPGGLACGRRLVSATPLARARVVGVVAGRYLYPAGRRAAWGERATGAERARRPDRRSARPEVAGRLPPAPGRVVSARRRHAVRAGCRSRHLDLGFALDREAPPSAGSASSSAGCRTVPSSTTSRIGSSNRRRTPSGSCGAGSAHVPSRIAWWTTPKSSARNASTPRGGWHEPRLGERDAERRPLRLTVEKVTGTRIELVAVVLERQLPQRFADADDAPQVFIGDRRLEVPLAQPRSKLRRRAQPFDPVLGIARVQK